MTAIVYPAVLPQPQAAPIQDVERRAISPDGPGPYEVRALQRDRHADVTITLPPMNAVLTAIFTAWWKNDLQRGGAWFQATWPLPQGKIPASFRMLATPRYEFIASPHGNFFLVSFPCEVRGRGMSPTVEVEDCDLLLHFDELLPSAWRDFSPFRRALVVDAGIGTIAGDASVGAFGGRGALVTNPNAGTNADVAHPLLTAAGRINFGAANLVICFFLDFVGGLPGNSGNYVFFNNINFDLTGGWLIQVSTNGDGSQSTLEFSFTTSAGLEEKHSNIDVTGLTGRHFFLCSRRDQTLTSYLDEDRYVSANAFTPGQAIDDTNRDVISLLSYPNSPGHRIAGFKGGIEEVYVNHGPTCGIDEANIVVPTVPLVSTLPIRTQLGLA